MKLLSYYRNLPSQHINTLWDCVYKDGVKAEKIREILLFYIHHHTCLPPLQKVFDTLLITLTGKLPSKKMKLLLFQCVEEICAWLDPECIVNTVRLLSNKTTAVEFLSCFSINSNIPSLIESDYLRLLR
uniref:Uncharacterized protein n=1 Tax=Clastoptera arizonana TaxID=38151 RepID=A0A1B6C6B6_9HEMI